LNIQYPTRNDEVRSISAGKDAKLGIGNSAFPIGNSFLMLFCERLNIQHPTRNDEVRSINAGKDAKLGIGNFVFAIGNSF